MADGNPEQLKKCLSAIGINSRTWKLYAEYGDALLRQLGGRWLSPDRPEESLVNGLAYLRLLNGCEIDMAPPQELVGGLAFCIPSGCSIDAMPVAIFRSAWRALAHAAYRGISATTFVDEEFVPVMSWFFQEGTSNLLDANRSKAGWSWLRGRWAEVRLRRSLPPANVEWTAPLRNAQVENCRFIPLQSIAALSNEGEVMRHCVADLAGCCQKGCIHVFSVRDARTLDRIATVALRGSGRSWIVADLKGPENSPPEDRVVRATCGFVRCLEEGTKTPPPRAKTCDECLY